MKKYKIPVTFSVCGYIQVSAESLAEANDKVIEKPEDFAPVDAIGRLSFADFVPHSLQYVDGTFEASYTNYEELVMAVEDKKQ